MGTGSFTRGGTLGKSRNVQIVISLGLVGPPAYRVPVVNVHAPGPLLLPALAEAEPSLLSSFVAKVKGIIRSNSDTTSHPHP